MKTLVISTIAIVLILLTVFSIESVTKLNTGNFSISHGYTIFRVAYWESERNSNINDWLINHGITIKEGDWEVTNRKSIFGESAYALAMPEMDQIYALIRQCNDSNEEDTVGKIKNILRYKNEQSEN